MLSRTLVLHARLIQAGADARLHVWEGIPHCAHAKPLDDLDVPEVWEIWSVIPDFITGVLGRQDDQGTE